MIKDLEFLFKKLFFSENFLLKRRLERAIKNNYEKELSIISNFKNKNKSAVDVGVYRGVYSYKLSKQFKHVYAYEPNPLIFPYLKKNLNKIIKNLTLKNFALSNSSGTVDLKIPYRSKSIFKDNVEELYKLGCATIQENKNYFSKLENFANEIFEKIKQNNRTRYIALCEFLKTEYGITVKDIIPEEGKPFSKIYNKKNKELYLSDYLSLETKKLHAAAQIAQEGAEDLINEYLETFNFPSEESKKLSKVALGTNRNSHISVIY